MQNSFCEHNSFCTNVIRTYPPTSNASRVSKIVCTHKNTCAKFSLSLLARQPEPLSLSEPCSSRRFIRRITRDSSTDCDCSSNVPCIKRVFHAKRRVGPSTSKRHREKGRAIQSRHLSRSSSPRSCPPLARETTPAVSLNQTLVRQVSRPIHLHHPTQGPRLPAVAVTANRLRQQLANAKTRCVPSKSPFEVQHSPLMGKPVRPGAWEGMKPPSQPTKSRKSDGHDPIRCGCPG